MKLKPSKTERKRKNKVMRDIFRRFLFEAMEHHPENEYEEWDEEGSVDVRGTKRF